MPAAWYDGFISYGDARSPANRGCPSFAGRGGNKCMLFIAAEKDDLAIPSCKSHNAVAQKGAGIKHYRGNRRRYPSAAL